MSTPTEFPPAVAMPGGWGVSYEGTTPPPAYAQLSPEKKLPWEALAASYLNRWTGGRFGLSEVTIRPRFAESSGSTFRGSGPRSSGRSWFAYGSQHSLTCRICGPSCYCSTFPYRVPLPGPVYDVSEVTIDGDTLHPDLWAIYPRDLLVRIDGQPWPRITHLTPQEEAEGKGWVVHYRRGTPAPFEASLAVGILAVEFWKSYSGDRTCQLPERLTSITREGVSVTVLDTFEDLQEGRTGIWMVDSWVASILHAPRPPRVASPDTSVPRFLP